MSRMANSIEPALQTTYDCLVLQEGGKMPLLDLQTWVGRVEKEGRWEWEVQWEYDRKPLLRDAGKVGHVRPCQAIDSHPRGNHNPEEHQPLRPLGKEGCSPVTLLPEDEAIWL